MYFVNHACNLRFVSVCFLVIHRPMTIFLKFHQSALRRKVIKCTMHNLKIWSFCSHGNQRLIALKLLQVKQCWNVWNFMLEFEIRSDRKNLFWFWFHWIIECWSVNSLIRRARFMLVSLNWFLISFNSSPCDVKKCGQLPRLSSLKWIRPSINRF